MNWQAFGASVQGLEHRTLALPCQDAHHWQAVPHGMACAVADGLGSVPKAAQGAAIAVQAAVAALANSTVSPADEAAIEQALRAAFQDARQALIQQAQDQPLRDYATTLLAAWITTTWTAVGQIGDGAIVGRWPDGQLETLSLPQRGEYANETTPLTRDDALERLQIKMWHAPIAAIALFSDGLQGLALNLASGIPYAPFFAPFFDVLAHPLDSRRASAQLAAFLDTERVCAKTGDDKTLLVAGPCGPIPTGPTSP